MSETLTFTAVLSRLRDLPPLPRVATQIVRVLGEDRSSAADVARLISGDPALAVKVLRIANSPFYGLSRQVKTLEHATMILGQRAIGALVLAAATLARLCAPASFPGRYAREAFWQHSVLTGVCARRIAETIADPDLSPHDAFLSGLLHDIGELALALFDPQGLASVIEYEVSHPGLTGTEAETAVLGYDHQVLGAEMLRRWALPSICVEVAERHHADGAIGLDTIVGAVQVADLVAAHLQPLLGKYSELRRQTEGGGEQFLAGLDGQAMSAPAAAQPILDSLAAELPKLLDESFIVLDQIRS